jgi:hypothetical protein
LANSPGGIRGGFFPMTRSQFNVGPTYQKNPQIKSACAACFDSLLRDRDRLIGQLSIITLFANGLKVQ